MTPRLSTTRRIQGLPAAPGIGIGTVVLYQPRLPSLPAPPLGAQSAPQEWRAFETACARLDAELAQQAQNENTLVAELFAAHRAILQDRTLLDSVHRLIFEEQKSALAATHHAISELTELFRGLEDEYFAGRSVDILDLGRRLMSHLSATTAATAVSAVIEAETTENDAHTGAADSVSSDPVLDALLKNLPGQAILLAEDLTPSELALLPIDRIQGIGLVSSTPTAHSAILAHSLGIPMACTLGGELLDLPQGDAVLDGTAGLLLFEPDENEKRRYATTRQNLREARILARRNAQSKAQTRDGVDIPVFANANRPADVAQSTLAGADGIGLLRTEYLFQARNEPPAVEEQAAIYAEFARQVRGPLVVRALDAGGDKPVRYIEQAAEENPFLGLRGIRLLIERPDLLRAQYRALQLAAQQVAQHTAQHTAQPETETSDLRFLLPMISTVEELGIVRELLQAENEQLPPLPIGIMIEVPSAALTAGVLAAQVDFLSIGTNDLAQYTLAVDRTNSAVARLADPLHPSVLRLIQMTCDAARLHNKPVAVCGEIAGDPAATPLLLGLGVTQLSAPLPDVAQIKEAVRSQTLASCVELAEAALACGNAAQVRALCADSA